MLTPQNCSFGCIKRGRIGKTNNTTYINILLNIQYLVRQRIEGSTRILILCLLLSSNRLVLRDHAGICVIVVFEVFYVMVN